MCSKSRRIVSCMNAVIVVFRQKRRWHSVCSPLRSSWERLRLWSALRAFARSKLAGSMEGSILWSAMAVRSFSPSSSICWWLRDGWSTSIVRCTCGESGEASW